MTSLTLTLPILPLRFLRPWTLGADGYSPTLTFTLTLTLTRTLTPNQVPMTTLRP